MKKVYTHIGNKDIKENWLKMKIEDAQRIYDQIEEMVNKLEEDGVQEQLKIEWNSSLQNSIECILEDFEESWRKL